WIAQRLQSTVATGTELWERVPELFPSLVFCPGVEQQMEELEAYSLPSIMRALIHLILIACSGKEELSTPTGSNVSFRQSHSRRYSNMEKNVRFGVQMVLNSHLPGMQKLAAGAFTSIHFPVVVVCSLDMSGRICELLNLIRISCCVTISASTEISIT